MQVLDYVGDRESREGYRKIIIFRFILFWTIILVTSQETPIISYLSKGGLNQGNRSRNGKKSSVQKYLRNIILNSWWLKEYEGYKGVKNECWTCNSGDWVKSSISNQFREQKKSWMGWKIEIMQGDKQWDRSVVDVGFEVPIVQPEESINEIIKLTYLEPKYGFQ